MTQYRVARTWIVDADDEDQARDLADNKYPDSEVITSRIDESIGACGSCGMAWFGCGQSKIGRDFGDEICCADCRKVKGETHAS